MSKNIKDISSSATTISTTSLFVTATGSVATKQSGSVAMAYNSTAALTVAPLLQNLTAYNIPTLDYPVKQVGVSLILHQPTEDLQFYLINLHAGKVLVNKPSRDFKAEVIDGSNVNGYARGIRKVGSQLVTNPKEVCDLSKDFTISRFIKISETRVEDATSIIWKSNGILFCSDTTNSELVFFIAKSDGTGWQTTVIIDTSFSTKYKNKNVLFVIVKSGLSVSFYANNVLIKTITLPENMPDNTANTNNFVDYLGGTTDVTDYRLTFFNYALSQSLINQLWNNGDPASYKLPYIQKYGSNTLKSPSQMKKGKRYQIKSINNGANFKLYGAIDNVIDLIFICNNDFNIPNNNGTVIQLGAVADYSSKGIVYDNSTKVVNKWLDNSYNQLHATVSGSPVMTYSADFDRLLNDNYARGIRKVGSQLVTNPKEVCDLSKDFTISRFIKISETRTNDFTSIINRQNGIYFCSDITNSNRLVFTAGKSDGTGWQTEVLIDTSFSTKYKNKNVLFVIVKSGLSVSFYANNVLIKTITLSENMPDNAANTNNFIDYLGHTTDVTDYRLTSFNYALTTSELSLLWNNGRPDKAILPGYMKWGSNTNITSGYNFTSGWITENTSSVSSNSFTTSTTGGVRKTLFDKSKKYRLEVTATNTSILNIRIRNGSVILTSPASATPVTKTVEFIPEIINTVGGAVLTDLYFQNECAGATAITEFKLTQIGAVADYSARGITTNTLGKAITWKDNSTNNLTATVAGTPDIISQLMLYQNTLYIQTQLSVTMSSTAMTILSYMPTGYLIDSVLLLKTSGSSTNSLYIRSGLSTSISNTISTLAYDSVTKLNNLYGFSINAHTTNTNILYLVGSAVSDVYTVTINYRKKD